MVFSRFRQGVPTSSPDFQEKLAQLKESFPEAPPDELERALKKAKGNYQEAAQRIGPSTSRSYDEVPNPKKLQRPAQRPGQAQYSSYGSVNGPTSPNNSYGPPMPPHYQPAFGSPPPQPGYMSPPPQMGHMSPPPSRYMSPPPQMGPMSPGYMSPPPQYFAPPYIRADPPSQVQENMRTWPQTPMAVPPYPSPHQPMTSWTPYRPRTYSYYQDSTAVPMYEMPPPDLMDYDMSWMIAVRLLPEWDKHKEDIHWDQVRRNRSAGMLREERDDCVVM